jgi:hypothetical protein
LCLGRELLLLLLLLLLLQLFLLLLLLLLLRMLFVQLPMQLLPAVQHRLSNDLRQELCWQLPRSQMQQQQQQQCLGLTPHHCSSVR